MRAEHIERQIITGLIISDEYLRKVSQVWYPELIEAQESQLLGKWCVEYYNQYNKAPQGHIQDIHLKKAAEEGIPDEVVELMELLLETMNDDFIQEGINTEFLWAETLQYFQERHLELHQKKIEDLLDTGEIEDAEKLAEEYHPLVQEVEGEIDLSDRKVLKKIVEAFQESSDFIVRWPGVLGEFWNDQMIRGGFVAFLAPEKRGKTFMLLEIAMRASKQKKNVAFIQAGDMTEKHQLLRISAYVSRKTVKEEYEGEFYEPVTDCIHNQLNTCEKKERECDFGVMEDLGWDKEKLKTEVTKDDLIEAYKDNPDYSPCKNCKEFRQYHWGTPWVRKTKVQLLGVREAKTVIRNFFIRVVRRFKLSSHMNDSLTLPHIRTLLTSWEKDGFSPDLIIIDYAELLDDPTKEHRHKQNNIWKGMRALSQKIWANGKQALVITATQADAKSYEQDWLKLSNFSEDKRKYGHVTAMYGLNQDKKGREKGMGVIRINELLKREGEPKDYVTVLQNLRIGRAFITSYK